MNVEVNAPMEFQVYTCKNRGVYSSIIKGKGERNQRILGPGKKIKEK